MAIQVILEIVTAEILVDSSCERHISLPSRCFNYRTGGGYERARDTPRCDKRLAGESAFTARGKVLSGCQHADYVPATFSARGPARLSRRVKQPRHALFQHANLLRDVVPRSIRQ